MMKQETVASRNVRKTAVSIRVLLYDIQGTVPLRLVRHGTKCRYEFSRCGQCQDKGQGRIPSGSAGMRPTVSAARQPSYLVVRCQT